jgi:hypothetical protein
MYTDGLFHWMPELETFQIKPLALYSKGAALRSERSEKAPLCRLKKR